MKASDAGPISRRTQSLTLRRGRGGRINPAIFCLLLVVATGAALQAAQSLAYQRPSRIEMMQQDFYAGRQAMDEISRLRAQLAGEQAKQRTATQQRIKQLGRTAVSEMQEAEKAAGPNNKYMPTILGNLVWLTKMPGSAICRPPLRVMQ